MCVDIDSLLVIGLDLAGWNARRARRSRIRQDARHSSRADRFAGTLIRRDRRLEPATVRRRTSPRRRIVDSAGRRARASVAIEPAVYNSGRKAGAQHDVGYSDDIDRRLETHRKGHGSPPLAAVIAA